MEGGARINTILVFQNMLRMRIITTLFLLLSAASAFSQFGNVGIGTNTPSSRLTVNGSVATGFKSIMVNAYTLNDSDYFVVYNGTGACTFSLPASISGNNNFVGRTYKVKNGSSSLLNLQSFTGEKISSLSNIALDSGSTVEVISTGTTTGSTWELVSLYRAQPIDNIRTALYVAGCASCIRYDTASINTWVSITAAEYNNLASLSGVVRAGTPPAQMSQNSNAAIGETTTITQEAAAIQFPSGSYPIALSIRTRPSFSLTTVSGLVLKLSNTALNSGYANYPASGSATPEATTNVIPSTVYYFLLKKPTTATVSGANYYMALYQRNSAVLGLTGIFSANGYYGNGDTPAPTIPYSGLMPQFQVLAILNKQW